MLLTRFSSKEKSLMQILQFYFMMEANGDWFLVFNRWWYPTYNKFLWANTYHISATKQNKPKKTRDHNKKNGFRIISNISELFQQKNKYSKQYRRRADSCDVEDAKAAQDEVALTNDEEGGGRNGYCCEEKVKNFGVW